MNLDPSLPSLAACVASNDQARAELRSWFAVHTGEAAILGTFLHAAAVGAHPAATLARLPPHQLRAVVALALTALGTAAVEYLAEVEADGDGTP